MSGNEDSLESELAQRTGLSADAVSQVLDSLAKIAYERAGVGFNLPGFGNFVVVEEPGIEGINPFSREPCVFRGKRFVEFTIDQAAEKSFIEGEDVTELDDSLGASDVMVLPEIRLEPNRDDLKEAGLDGSSATKANTKMGGEPFWIQGPEDIVCCGRPAVFYGQFDSTVGGDFNIVDGGTLYVFLCHKCWTPRGLVQYY